MGGAAGWDLRVKLVTDRKVVDRVEHGGNAEFPHSGGLMRRGLPGEFTPHGCRRFDDLGRFIRRGR